MDRDEEVLRRGLSSAEWDLALPSGVVETVRRAVAARRRRRVALIGLASAGVLAIVATPFVLRDAAGTRPGPVTPAVTSTARSNAPLMGWTLRDLPAGYADLPGDSSSTAAVGPNGFHNDGTPAGSGEVEVSVALRRYQNASGGQLTLSVLKPWQKPGIPPAGSEAARISHELVVGMYGPSAAATAVPGVPAGSAVLVRENAKSFLIIIAGPQAEVAMLTGNGPTVDELVAAARSLQRTG